jgi:hypothetical protein
MHAGQILYFWQMSRITSKKTNYKFIFNIDDHLRFTQENNWDRNLRSELPLQHSTSDNSTGLKTLYQCRS